MLWNAKRIASSDDPVRAVLDAVDVGPITMACSLSP
jgi:hypothetical protein